MLQAVVSESSWIGGLQGLGASRAAIVGTPGLGGWQESSHQVGPWLGMLESWGGRKKPQKLQGSGLVFWKLGLQSSNLALIYHVGMDLTSHEQQVTRGSYITIYR